MTLRRRPRGFALSVALRYEPEDVMRVIVAPGAIAAGRRIRELPIGEHTWVALVVRAGPHRAAARVAAAGARRRGGAAE